MIVLLDITISTADFTTALGIIASYIILFLALYGISSIAQLLRARLREKDLDKQAKKDLVSIYLCLIGLMLIEALRQIWDTSHTEHFPIGPSRIFLLYLLPTCGNAGYRLYHSRKKWFRKPDQVKNKLSILQGHNKPRDTSMLGILGVIIPLFHSIR